MKYYKIMIDKEIKGVVNSQNFFIENYGKLISSTDSLGQFAEYEGKLYRDYWMQPIPNNRREYLDAIITEISMNDYFAYLQAKENNEAIIIDDDNEPEQEQPIISENIEEQDALLESIRDFKLNEMSRTCRATIEAGFDLELRGEMHHFSLDTQDQLNLISLSEMAKTQSQIPYHADGELCVFYTSEEINQIVSVANTFKIKHTTYYNALKNYINTLETIKEITAIEYGTPIPEEYQSEVLRVLQ